ncbi:MAG: hypothetical protein Q7R45_12340, partial [Sulfuricaulis sp.]|nr:hypothetical protein [Sulfuricaulis sp.]
RQGARKQTNHDAGAHRSTDHFSLRQERVIHALEYHFPHPARVRLIRRLGCLKWLEAVHASTLVPKLTNY